MLKLRQLKTVIIRVLEKDTGGRYGEKYAEELTQEVYFTDWRTATIPVMADFDIFEANIDVLTQDVRKLRKRNAPKFVEYNGAEYLVNEKTISSLREISELADDENVLIDYKSRDKLTKISGVDALAIRKLMNSGTQSAFRKFTAVSTMIDGIKDIEAVEAFD